MQRRSNMLISSLVCALIGTFLGSLGGALILGWDASMAEGSSWIGPTRDFWPLAAYVGALAGAAFGLSLGLYISLTRAGFGVSAIVGGIVGIIGVLVLVSNISGGNAELRSLPSRVGPLMLSLIIWVLIGLLLAVIANGLRKMQSA